MNIIQMKVKDIKPYEKNAKKHDKTQIANVAESINRFGFAQPLVVDKDNVLIIGHCRLLAAKQLKLREVPVLRMEELTEEQVKQLRLLDNKLNESDWDIELLQDEVAELDFDGFDLDWGFKELEDSAVIEDEAPEPDMENPPISKLGDVWQLGRHRLMCGDSTDPDMVAKLMNGEQADLLVTDPPYNVDYEGKTKDAMKIQNDSMSDDSFRSFLVDAFTNAINSLKAGAAFYIWHADSEGYNFRTACKTVGMQIRQCLIWQKNSMVMGRQDYQWRHEPCLYGWKDGAGHKWNADRRQTTILEFDRPTKSDLHPTMKPVNLISYQVRNSSEQDDIVLDLFGGSGSTLMACEQLNRSCFTMEYDPRYADVIVKRWENFTHKKAVLLNDKEERG